jgi:hypothetical protein
MRLTEEGCSTAAGFSRQGNGGDGTVQWSSAVIDGSVRCSWLLRCTGMGLQLGVMRAMMGWSMVEGG